MNSQTQGKMGTILFVGLAVCAWVVFLTEIVAGNTNLWIFGCGVCLWLLGVANAKINELCKPNGE